MLVRGSSGSYESIDFRETMPSSGFQDMYNNDRSASVVGGAASGVPSELRGLEYLHQNYGVLPWETVVMPAVSVARDGFAVTEDLVRYMAFATGSRDFLCDEPTWAIDFCPDGTRLGLGDSITRKRYANTLETIARQGADVFYEGQMAEATIDALNAATPKGIMTLKDLKDYKVEIRPTAQITYRGYKLSSCTSPSSGGVVLAMLKTVEGYDYFFQGESTLNLSTHRMDEAIRFAYGERAELGDPAFVHGLAEYQTQMLQANTAAGIRARISDYHTLNVSAYDPMGLESLDTPGTSHIVTADASGMAVSLTTTINLLFGSQVMVPETGVIMNDENNDFSIPGSKDAFGYVPSPSNFIRGGKRSMSSITPVIVENPDGTLYYVIGAAGGSRIITATIQNLVNVLDRNMTTAEALEEPRLHDQLIPNLVAFEYTPFGYNNATIAYMKTLGHNVTWVPPGISSAQGIRRLPNGTFEAAGEPRQKNSAGYTI